MEFKMKENGFQIDLEYGTLDVSGNEQYGYRPYQLLVSSIAVCSGGVFRKVLEKKRITYENITIEADVKRNEEGVNEVTDIALHFIIEGCPATEKQIEKSLEIARKNCPIVQSVQGSINVTESFEQK
ncbi:OsmC family protein [Bacillus sp. JCM 19034]|uniref:OsmC family protein n=1 Tax=Bacillus sp. JCM 19034 TaxID=1481928 RepID=UPI0007812903|nr:OsmC family protein [Bacillus sp. JCM 19034]